MAAMATTIHFAVIVVKLMHHFDAHVVTLQNIAVSIVKNRTSNITRITARQFAKSYARVEESMACPAWEDGEEELVRGGDILHM